jgi:hypothetical protein
MNRIRRHLEHHGHLAVALPTDAGARAGELVAGVSELLRRPDHLWALTELADAWAPSVTERAAVTWGDRAPDDPRGGKSHLQTVAGFDRYVDADPTSPELLRAVVRRLTMFGAAADRLLGRLAVPAHCMVRANLYEPDGGEPTHVDDSVFTIVFTDQPGSVMLALGGRRAPLRAVAAHGWHAIVLPGAHAWHVVPGLAPSPHAAVPNAHRRRSISVYSGCDPAQVSDQPG